MSVCNSFEKSGFKWLYKENSRLCCKYRTPLPSVQSGSEWGEGPAGFGSTEERSPPSEARGTQSHFKCYNFSPFIETVKKITQQSHAASKQQNINEEE